MCVPVPSTTTSYSGAISSMMRYNNVPIAQTTNRRVGTRGCVGLESVNIEVISAKADVHKAPQGCIIVGSECSLHVSEEALP